MQDEWLTVAEVARHFQVSRQTIYRWVGDGSLTAYRMDGKGWQRFRRADIDRLMHPTKDTQPVGAQDE